MLRYKKVTFYQITLHGFTEIETNAQFNVT
jgi:hypothetical protein